MESEVRRKSASCAARLAWEIGKGEKKTSSGPIWVKAGEKKE